MSKEFNAVGRNRLTAINQMHVEGAPNSVFCLNNILLRRFEFRFK